MTAVAVIGAGRMGSAMASRLAGAGHALTLWNRTRARAERAAERAAAQAAEQAGAQSRGAAVADTPREAAQAGEVVLVSLADDAAVTAAYAGDDGLLAGLRPGAIVLEMSTVRPDTVRGLAEQVRARGAELLDAPVSGSVSVVDSGALTVMVGGSPQALERVRGVLEPLASHVFPLGAVGAGATMKLVVNALLLGLNQALAEALVLAEKAGIPRADAYAVFESSAVAAPFVHYKRQAYLEPDAAPVAFMLQLVAKDLGLAAELAGQVGARVDQPAVNLDVAREAVAGGLGERDLSAIAVLLRQAGAL
jgi:3-hydroxyisobutyrate dehydrogenase/2-hydroxy-3-oxopropionate reductase